jgi:hydroxyacylglutathione hydrolase
MTQTITAIPAFSDNYIWAIGSTDNNHLVLVDPGDANVCIEYINTNNLTLTAILITHHHADHTGGINALLNFNASLGEKLAVYGPAKENIPQCEFPLNENDIVNIKELDLTLKVIDLPGHTLGHIAYVNNIENNTNILFCGDTLFSGGCGRLFEGSAEQMFTSLKKLSSLADNTQVYCAHEYTLANLTFALAVEPNNQELAVYYQQVKQLRQQNRASIPSSIHREKKINPFLRAHSAEIKANAQKHAAKKLNNSIDVFAAIRQWKDTF